MKMSRLVLFGGMVGGAAAWAYLTTEGLISAAGLIVGVFDLLVVGGIALALTTEGFVGRSIASAGASLRAFRHRHAAGATCGVCARFVFDNGAARFCPSCDMIPAVVIA
jgi:hypothetical protein